MACAEKPFRWLLSNAIPKCLLEKYDFTQKLKAKYLRNEVTHSRWGGCVRGWVWAKGTRRVKCRWRRFRDDKWSRKGWSGLERKEAKETIARGQTLERINAKNGIVFYSWKNTDLRQLQLFADNFRWLLVVEFSLTDSPCLFFTLERAESLGLKCSFWRIEIFPGKLLRLLYHSKNYKNSVCQ